ncbi:MAG: hypothetical protein K5651_07130 [Bacteroidales bacterium]|nr:hypothetical protein [Bacteroidales bacterium]
MFVKIDGSYINLGLVHSIDVYDDGTATLWFAGVDGLCRDVTADDLKVIEGAIRHECVIEKIEPLSPCLEVDLHEAHQKSKRGARKPRKHREASK